MKLYKPKYSDRCGRTKECQCWYVGLTHNKKRHRVPLFRSRKESEIAMKYISDIIDSTVFLSPDMVHWYDSIPNKLKSILHSKGLVNACGIDNLIGIVKYEEDNFSGVYFLSKKNRIVYVGQSKCIPLRIRGHLWEKKVDFDEVYYCRVKPESLIDVENYFIELLKPKGNKIGIGFAKLKSKSKNSFLQQISISDMLKIKQAV